MPGLNQGHDASTDWRAAASRSSKNPEMPCCAAVLLGLRAAALTGAPPAPPNMWGSSEEEFAIDLDDEECAAALPAHAAPQAVQIKRPRNAGSTPERFRPLAAPGGDGEAAVAAAADSQASDRGGGQPDSQAGGSWRLRSIFLGSAGAGQPTQAPAQQQQQKECEPPQQWRPGGDSRAQLQATAPPAAGPLSPGLGWSDDEDVGPLTQMAAASAPVAAAFCPTCGCFLPDLGSTHQQGEHTAACAAAAAARASPAARSQRQQHQQQQHPHQQQQQQTPGGLAAASGNEQLGAAEGDGSLAASEDEEEEEDGNWSEQEEATQAAADGDGLAAAAGEAAGSEDGWEVAADDAAAEEGSLCSGGGSAGEQEQQQTAAPDERATLRAWLAQHGVDKYADHFERAGEAG